MEQTAPTAAQQANIPIVKAELILQSGPAAIANKKPENWPVIISVPVATVGSIGKVSSPEKFMPTGIIGTMTSPMKSTATAMRSVFVVVNRYVPILSTIVVPMQLNLIIALNFCFRWIRIPEQNDIIKPRTVVPPQMIDVLDGEKIPANNGPRTDPNAMKDPSTMPNARSKIK